MGEPLVNFARSSPEMESESGCQCSKISVTLTNGAKKAQSSRQGTYQRSALVNGKPSWTTNSQAIWYVPESKFWCIGALSGIGTDICGVSSAIGINDRFLNCPYGVPKNSWEFHSSESGWTPAGLNDVNVNCLNEQGTVRSPQQLVACQTVSGPDTHKSCKFPFVYQGKLFFTCITVDNGHQTWCATEVDDKNHLIIDKWGSCSNSCPSSVQTTGKGTGRDKNQLISDPFDPLCPCYCILSGRCIDCSFICDGIVDCPKSRAQFLKSFSTWQHFHEAKYTTLQMFQS